MEVISHARLQLVFTFTQRENRRILTIVCVHDKDVFEVRETGLKYRHLQACQSKSLTIQSSTHLKKIHSHDRAL